MFTLWNTTFPVKCLNSECNGKCSYSIKFGRGVFCSQYNLLMKCINKSGERDFHLYWSFELNPGINPLIVTLKNDKKFWFRCPISVCGCHVWQAQMRSFTSGSRCPFCCGLQTCPCDSAGNQVKDLAMYWHPTKNLISPYEISFKSHKKFWFRCPKSVCECHTWQAKMYSFTSGSRCPFCHGLQTCPCDSAGNQVKDLAMYWHPTKNLISPYEISCSSNIKVWFKCPIASCDHHEWQAQMCEFNRGSRCPFCCRLQTCPCDSAGNQVKDLAMYWHPTKNLISPYEISCSSNIKVWFKCPIASCDHHEWQACMSDFNRGTRCPFCSKRNTCFCDSAWTNNINIRYGWNRSLNRDIDPRTVSKQNDKKFWFNCLKNKHPSFQRKMNSYNKFQNCPQCITAGISRKEKIIIRVFEIWLNQASLNRYRIDNIGKIDGYFPSVNISVEFHGCFWHGCPKCFPIREKINPINNLSYQDLYDRTLKRDAKLRQLFNHRVIWECEIEPYLNSPQASILCINSIYNTKQLYEMACQQIQDEDLDNGNLPTDILTEEDFQRFDAMQALKDCEI